MSSNIGRQLSLQVAYQISEDTGSYDVTRLFWAMDRFWADRHMVDVHCQHQRGEATQRIAKELDARNIRVRHPDVEAAAVAKIMEELGPLPQAA